MAEALDDIIIIEEGDAADSDYNNESGSLLEEEQSSKKKLVIFGIAGLFLLFIIIVFLIFIFKSSNENNAKLNMDYIETKLDKQKTVPIEPSKLENMIAKANYLYSSGSKEEALYLYEKIAHYSEAISVYNLGVAQLKDETYDIALKTFQKAILNDEKRCVSAINAAVCSLHLKDKVGFQYYIDLAYAYLANEKTSSLYSYYYTLIQYYNNNYYEALSALENPTSDEYHSVTKHLRAKINALYSNDYKAIEAMEENFDDDKDPFSIALLYARVGDLTLAKKHLAESIIRNIEPVKSAIAQAFINLKAGQIHTASKQISNVTDMFPEEVYKPYPVKVKLKEALFNPLKAQLKYRDTIVESKKFNYQKLFYFAPYKIFNPDQSISYIQKGNANVYIDNLSSAKRYLEKSSSDSTVNQGITKAIRKALSFELRDANTDLKKLLLLQPKHSILHYNLALTYAQMADMPNAYKHFLLSFHLDAKNYLSGIFAVMSGQILGKNISKLSSIVRDSISLEEKEDEDINLYSTLLSLSNDDILAMANWLDRDHKQRAFYLIMDTIIATKLNNIKLAKKSSHQLVLLLPNEIVPHMIYIDTHFEDLKPKQYARRVLVYLKEQKFNYNDLYYGPYITRYLYTQQSLITGQLYYLRKQLRDKLESTNKDTQGITSALALATLYDKAFEESYTLYNHLIDNLKVRDAYTLFLGAVASTAAGHHANAIALLELSKMKDTTMLESRYALGLLYLEVKNNKGAVIQFAFIGNNGFRSEFFNFDIDTDKLLFEKEQLAKK